MKKSKDVYRLGSLLVSLGMVTEVWIRRSLTLSHFTGLPIGKSLLLLSCITPDELRAVIEVQWMLKDKLIDLSCAREALSIVRRSHWSLADALVVLGIDAHYVRGTRLGELLIGSGGIDATQLDIALGASDTAGLPLGRVLILLNQSNEALIESALAIQREIRAGTLDRAQAITLLQLSRKYGIKRESPQYIKIGKLFVVASVLSREEIRQAILEARESRRMLGQILLEKNKISEEILVAALKLQDMVWKGAITVGQAAEVLTNISKFKIGVVESLLQMGIKYEYIQRNLTLCDFLRIAGYLSGKILDDIISKTLCSPEFLGQTNSNESRLDHCYNNESLLRILKTTRKQDSQLINSATVLYELVCDGKMRLDQALVHFSMVQLKGIQQRKVAA